ncbi:tetratricopeptide repeat protein [Anaeromyxobacter oryzisoli]|uniref:tetratricopeptide repeat protein n=1 Tax=Anaeromyxobacter oryzisoli TaxID=2925408 RepID=UPI001F563EE0|nr:tetratricopeptide repeat protein [Anaeromyxobacter sp. SG63]
MISASRGRGVGRALAFALVLAASGCGSSEGRLEAANALRHKGDQKGALEGYKVLLADLGEGPLGDADSVIRRKALRFAADVSYLELGDYSAAIAYYRRVVSLYPGSKEALEARAITGEILRDRFDDRLGAIAQWADVAQSQAPEAPKYQLEIARAYLELKRYEQARAEARKLQERWPDHELADEAQLLTGQAWALERQDARALGAFEALLQRGPRPDMAARVLEAEAHIQSQQGKFDRALELYARALPAHPNPDSVRTAISLVRERRDRAKIALPGRTDAFK